jgi:hypothetical protein
MAKTPTAGSSRRPPTPSESPADIDAWLARQMPDLRPIVDHLDGMIRRTIPEPHYGVKWKKAYYGSPEVGWILEMVAYDVSVNLVFFGGATLAPPPPLGSTGRSRYVKLRSLDEARDPQIEEWLQQATHVPGWT